MAERPPPVVRAASDCERCRPGLVTQPVNTASSLAYVAAGAAALAGARRRPAGARPGTRAVAWSLLAMTGLVALSDVHHDRGTAPTAPQVAAVGALAGAAAHPRTSAAAQAVAAAGALGAEVHRHLTGAGDAGGGVLAAAVFVAGLALHVGGRTGRPLCRPDSPLQAHAAWHVLSAAALYLRTRVAAGASAPE